MSVFGAMSPRRARQLWYAPVLALSTALMMVRLLVLARLLDVAGFSHVSVAFLISGTFVMLGCLGLQALLQRDMPVMFVRGRERAARVLLAQGVVAAYALGAVALVAAAALGGAAGYATGFVLLGLLHGISQQLFLLASVESRSRGEPLRYAVQSLVRSVLVIGAGIATAALTSSAAAVVAAEALASLLIAHRILWTTVGGTRPATGPLLRLAVRTLPRVDWRAAVVLLLVSLLGFALANVDRWAAASVLDTQAFGNYAFAATIVTIGVGVQGLLNASVYPLLARLHAREGQAACYALAARLSLLLLAGSLVLAVLAYPLLERAIHAWYPKFDTATALLPAFLLVAALRVSDFWSSFMMVTGFQDRLLKVNLLAGAAGGLAWLAFARPWGGGVPDASAWAWLAAILSVSGYVAVAWSSRRCTREGARR